MLAERWRQIDEIFIAALNLSPDRRASFLTDACGSDEELRREVESLLAAHEQVGDFINAPALEIVAKGVAREAVNAPAAVPATKISSYEILSLLGAGGMSEVYLARDVRLGRPVALKLLSPQFLQDAERVRRFEREGRAASALNHPNILTIYEAGQTGETYFIATEYIEGKTLRQLITSGGLKIQEALNIVLQIAEALESAHRAGIVHRDIKPENIMIRPDGYVKVLDFGLAKLTENFKALIRNQEFTFGSELTSPGIIMGTLTYMSPEQASGGEVDHRTDIWSLGVLIYEILTGCPPFKGYDAQCTLEAILNQEPPRISLVGCEQSPELERIIARALEKDRELRFQTVSDLRSELKRLQRDLELSSAVSEAEKAQTGELLKKRFPAAFDPRNLMRSKTLFSIGAAAVVLVAVCLFILQQLKIGNDNLPFKYASVNRLTEQAGAESYPSLSADGRAFVYASRATGKWKIYWQRAGGKMPMNLTQNQDSDDTQPAFSPDNKQIAFRSSRDGGGIFIMGATGESVKRVADFGYNPAWSPDGKKIVFATDNIVDAASRPQIPSQIWIVDIESGEKRRLATADGVQPTWSPGGHRIAYWGVQNGGERDIWTLAVDGDEPFPVTDDASTDWNPVWSPDGKYLYFISDRTGSMNVWRILIDEQSGKVLGQPEPVTTPSTYSAFLSFSKNGKLAYVQVNDQANLQHIEFDPVREVTVGQYNYITQGLRRLVRPSVSPAGDWLVYYRQDFQEDIFISKPDGTDSPRQLTNDEHRDRMPRLSPDGSQIVFFSDRSGRYENWIINRDGSELRQLTETSGRGLSYATWSPDGRHLACAIQGGNSFIIETEKRWVEQTPQYLPQMDKPDESMAARSWSPDGRKLAGGRVRDGRGGFGLAVYSFDSQKCERLLDYGNDPVWLNDSRRLLFAFQGKIYLIDSKTKRLREILSVAPNGINGFDITHENRNIYFSLTVSESDIWLLDLVNSKFSPNENK